MARIKRWDYQLKEKRRQKIGDYIPCPICSKTDALSTWEGERYLLCRFCGAFYQKKQRYIKPKPEKVTHV